MGRNKALILVGSRFLWQRQYELLAAAGASERWISLRSGDDWPPPEIPRVYDDGAAGPLGGLLATLDVCGGTHLAVLAVDLPRLPVSWFQTMRDGCVIGRGSIGWRTDIGAHEPLAAIYPRELVPQVRQAVIEEEFSLQKLVSSAVAAGLLQVHAILPEQLGWFANWNTPEDVRE